VVADLSLVAGGRAANGSFGERSAEQCARAPNEQPGAQARGGGSLLPAPAKPTLSEVFAASARDGGATGFLLDRLPRGKPLLWVQERMAIIEAGRIYPPGLDRIDLIHVEARDARDALWAMEEGLRCSGLGAVIGELWGDPAALDFTATRRLAVAAERNGVAAWLVRLGGAANLSGARMRWRVASAASRPNGLNSKASGVAAWDAELFRARGFAPGRWLATGDDPASREGAQDPVDLVAAARDRAVAAAGGGRG